MDKIFGMRDGVDKERWEVITLPVGGYEFYSERPCGLVLNDAVIGQERACRFLCVDEAQLRVSIPPSTWWQLEPYRDSAAVDGTPHEGLLLEPRPESQEAMIARMLSRMVVEGKAEESETFDEANDFDVSGDDDLPFSPAEMLDMAFTEMEGMTDEEVQLQLDESRGRVKAGGQKGEASGKVQDRDEGAGDSSPGQAEQGGDDGGEGSSVRKSGGRTVLPEAAPSLAKGASRGKRGQGNLDLPKR